MILNFAFLALPGLLLAGLPAEQSAFSSGSAAMVSTAGDRQSALVNVQDNSNLRRWLQLHRAGSGAPAPSETLLAPAES